MAGSKPPFHIYSPFYWTVDQGVWNYFARLCWQQNCSHFPIPGFHHLYIGKNYCPFGRVGNSLLCSFTLSLLSLARLKRANRSCRSFYKSKRVKSKKAKKRFTLFKSGRWRENFKFILFSLLFPFACPKQKSESLSSLLTKRAIHTKNLRSNSQPCLLGRQIILGGGGEGGDLSKLKGSSAHIELSNPVLPSTEKISHPWLRTAGQILYAVDNDGGVMLIRVGWFKQR